VPSWEKKASIPFSSLSKSLFAVAPGTSARELNERYLPPLPKATDLEVCGCLNVMKASEYQQANCRKPTPVKESTKLSFCVSTSDDPVITRIAKQIREEESDKIVIFATDNIVAAIMSAPRSVVPWGITAVRDGRFIYLDVSDGSMVNVVTVNESDSAVAGMDTSDPESINSPNQLWREATYVSDKYAQHVVSANTSKPAVEFEHPCPFLTDEDKQEGKEAAPVAYRYRRFVISETLDLVVRCELQALSAPCTPDAIDGNLVEICSLNEWNLANTKWATQLDTRSGLVLAQELKSNTCRMTRATAKAYLSGATKVHIGFVSRKSAADNKHHCLLSSVLYNTPNFATQLSITERNLWGIADTIFQAIVPLPDGQYFITKQDATQNIFIYSTPEEQPASSA